VRRCRVIAHPSEFKESVYLVLVPDIGLAFVRKDPPAHVNSHTFYLTYTGPLPRGSDVKSRVYTSSSVSYYLYNLSSLH
jgi:hypothetical protein